MGIFGDLGKQFGNFVGGGGLVGQALNSTTGAITNALGVRNPVNDVLQTTSKLGSDFYGGLWGMRDKLDGPSGSSASGTAASNYGSGQPWSQSNQSMNGQNFKTTNFGYDSQGRPNALPFETIRDSNGNLGSQFKLNGRAPISMDQTAYNKYLGEATSNGPSSWASLAMDKNNQGTMNNLNKVGALGASTMADSMSNLQMSGGMNGAQRERTAMNTGRDMMKMRMDTLNQGNMNNSNILMQDGQNKMNMLPQAYNMSMNNAKFGQDERAYQTDINQYNMGNMLKDVGGFNNYNQNMYNESMKGWAALKSSEAQAKSAAEQAKNSGGLFGQGGFLGLGIG